MAAQARPDVLGYPEPTTARYLIFATALLACGLFIGNFVHLRTQGQEWSQTMAACAAAHDVGRGFEEAFARNQEYVACTAGVERTRAAIMVGGAVVLGGVAAGLLWLAPMVVIRRRGLRALPAALSGTAARFDELAAEARVSGRVVPLLGRTGQRDAFTFGAPGRYRVVLPPAAAVRFRDRATFDPLVQHELAHVAHHDVALAWLTRLIWVALVPALAFPVVWGLVSGDLSILRGYSWRSALLAIAVALLSADLLRTREFGADLRAARWGGGLEPLVRLVGRTRSPEPTRLARVLGSRVLAKHPTADERVAVLGNPALVTVTGFRDGLTGAFLAGLAVPLLASAVTPLLTQLDQAGTAYVLASVLLGPILAGAVGLELGRSSLFARAEGRDAPALGVGIGVGIGLMLGQAVSLTGSALAGPTALEDGGRPAWLLVSGVAGTGAVLVASGLGHLWADAAPRLPGIRFAWVTGFGLSSIVFSSLLWASSVFQEAVGSGGWGLGRLVVPSVLSPWPMFWLILVLATGAGAALALRSSAARVATPGWLVEGGEAPPWPPAAVARLREPLLIGLAAGLAGAVALAAFRLWAGAAAGDAAVDRFLAYQWLAGLTAAGTVLAAVVARPARGAGLALVSGPTAVVVILLGYLALNLALGGGAALELTLLFVRPAIGIGFYLTLLLAVPAALLGALAHRAESRSPPAAHPAVPPGPRARPLVAVLAVSVLAGGSLAGLALLARASLVPGDPDEVVDRFARIVPTTQDADPVAALVDYERRVAASIEARYDEASLAAQRIWRDPGLDAPTRAALTSREVVDPVRAILADWGGYRAQDPGLAAAHTSAVDALRTAEERYGLLTDPAVTEDQEALARFARLGEVEADHWNRWRSSRSALAEDLLDP